MRASLPAPAPAILALRAPACPCVPVFNKQAKTAKKRMQCKNMKLNAVIALVVVIILAVLLHMVGVF